MPHKSCLYWFKTGQVFHTASAGLTGPGQLNKKLCYSVNLDGTRLAKVSAISMLETINVGDNFEILVTDLRFLH